MGYRNGYFNLISSEDYIFLDSDTTLLIDLTSSSPDDRGSDSFEEILSVLQRKAPKLLDGLSKCRLHDSVSWNCVLMMRLCFNRVLSLMRVIHWWEELLASMLWIHAWVVCAELSKPKTKSKQRRGISAYSNTGNGEDNVNKRELTMTKVSCLNFMTDSIASLNELRPKMLVLDWPWLHSIW